MSRRLLLRTAIGALVILVAIGGRIFWLEIGRTFSPDPTVWEPEIGAFESADQERPPPDGAILFVGSSSIRFWDDLDRAMAPLTVFRRGFGGARLSDLVHHANRIILPYSPRAIVIHAGGNELNDVPGNTLRTPPEAFEDFRALIALIRGKWPTLPIYYLELRPSRQPGPREPFLELVRAECEADADLHYLAASEPLSRSDGSADPALLAWDRTHLNAEGYARWAPPIRERLLEDLGPND